MAVKPETPVAADFNGRRTNATAGDVLDTLAKLNHGPVNWFHAAENGDVNALPMK